jgi:hypothetical protein
MLAKEKNQVLPVREVPEREKYPKGRKKSTRSCKWEKYQVLPVGEVLNAAGGKSIRCFRWEKYWYQVLSREKYQVPPVGVELCGDEANIRCC